MDRQAVYAEMERARASFHALLDAASEADLRRASNGTCWTNQQLLFHMLLGYLIVRALTMLVRVFGRLPAGASRVFARGLNAATRPFDVVNFAGSSLAGRLLGRRRMAMLFDRVIAVLHRRLDAETDADLARGMHYPTRWDPFFADFMTLAEHLPLPDPALRLPPPSAHPQRRPLTWLVRYRPPRPGSPLTTTCDEPG